MPNSDTMELLFSYLNQLEIQNMDLRVVIATTQGFKEYLFVMACKQTFVPAWSLSPFWDMHAPRGQSMAGSQPNSTGTQELHMVLVMVVH